METDEAFKAQGTPYFQLYIVVLCVFTVEIFVSNRSFYSDLMLADVINQLTILQQVVYTRLCAYL